MVLAASWLSGSRMYCRLRSPLLPLLVVALAGACGWRTGFQLPAPGPDTSARPVGLITTGSAFERAGVRRRVAETLERASQRRVVLLDAPASVRDAAVKDLAARLIRANPSIVGYDWRELRCASAGVLTAITRQVDAVYRVSLDYVERSRPATATATVGLAPTGGGRTSTAGGRGVRTAALGTIREAVKRRPRRADDDAAHGLTRGEASEVPETSAPDAAARAGSSATPAQASEQQYSCSELCGMHMIELCNRDKSLWDSHGRRWEPTACGTMREEAFLKECYRQQWLSGAFHDACLVPCEREEEGRDRLLDLLQGAGCLRHHPS